MVGSGRTLGLWSGLTLITDGDISRIKTEIKTEIDMMDGEPPVKRLKMEN